MTVLENIAITQANTWHEIVRLKKEVKSGKLTRECCRNTLDRIAEHEEKLYDLKNEVHALVDKIAAEPNNSKPPFFPDYQAIKK